MKSLTSVLAVLAIIFSGLEIFKYEADTSSSLKFVHSFTKLQVRYTEAKRTSDFEFKRNSITRMNYRDICITGIDAPIKKDPEQIEGILISGLKHYLFIGPGADLTQVAGLCKNDSLFKIVLHPGIGKNKKAELLRLIDEKFWDKIHSLRENGSLEFFL